MLLWDFHIHTTYSDGILPLPRVVDIFGQSGHDLKSLLRGGASDDEIRNEIAAVWQRRDDRYSEIRTAATSRERKVEMSYIGG